MEQLDLGLEAGPDLNLEPEVDLGLSRELKPWEPKKIKTRQELVWTLHACGLRNVEIAEALGYSQSRVCIILNDPRAKPYIDEMASKVSDALTDTRLRLKLYANEALDRIIEEVRECEDEAIAQRACFGILDRAGYGKIEKRAILKGELTRDDASHLAEALRETGSEVFQDAEYVIEDY